MHSALPKYIGTRKEKILKSNVSGENTNSYWHLTWFLSSVVVFTQLSVGLNANTKHTITNTDWPTTQETCCLVTFQVKCGKVLALLGNCLEKKEHNYNIANAYHSDKYFKHLFLILNE